MAWPLAVIEMKNPSDENATLERALNQLQTYKADDLFTIKGNAPETCTTLTTCEWQTEATRHYQDQVTLAHGRIEQRSIAIFTLPQAMINDPHVKQIVGMTRHSMDKTTEDESTGSAFGMTSVDASRVTPQHRLAWTHGHGLVERHHPVRNVTFKENGYTVRQCHHQHHRDRRDPGGQSQDR